MCSFGDEQYKATFKLYHNATTGRMTQNDTCPHHAPFSAIVDLPTRASATIWEARCSAAISSWIPVPDCMVMVFLVNYKGSDLWQRIFSQAVAQSALKPLDWIRKPWPISTRKNYHNSILILKVQNEQSWYKVPVQVQSTWVEWRNIREFCFGKISLHSC